MKWFKVDTNTPDDPKIRGLIKRQGNAAFGALVRLWCYVGAHGSKRPGWALDSQGRPIDKNALADTAGLTLDEFDVLMSDILESGHANKTEWKKRGTLVFPAMFKRSDTYSQRVVRTKVAQSSKFVPVEEKRKEEKRSVQVQELEYSGASAPRKKSPKNGHDKDPYPVVLKLTFGVLGRIPIKKPVEMASLKEDVKRQCAKYGINYSANDVVGRAVESALATRAKLAVPDGAKKQ